MSVLVGSRYTFCTAVRDDAGRLMLTEREPFGYVALPDNRTHTVVQGDTLFALAGRYFAPLPRACGYWWAIADFQPPDGAIVDPTLQLEVGRVVLVPSLRVLTDIILGESRRRSA
jgi:hypothetical protein